LPTGRAVLEELVEAAAQNDGELASLHAALNDERYSEVAEIIHNRMGPAEKIAVAKAAFERPTMGELGGTHRDLRDIGFASAITSSWDPLVSQVGRRVHVGGGGPRDASVLYAKRTGSIPKTFDDAAFYLVRLHGDLDHPDTFSFTAEEAYAALQENRTLHRYVTSLILSRTVLFLGTGLGGIEDFFRGAGIMNIAHSPTTAAGHVHYALVPFSRDWSIQVERFRAKYGIQLLGYTPSEGHPQVGQFIERLAQLVRDARAGAPERVLAADILSEVRLRNIGAFRDVTVSFNSGWNVILGSNGSGKSTILKAIALGLCGDDQSAAAAGATLLRRGRTTGSGHGVAGGSLDGSADDVTDGSIEIQVGSTRYTTALRRENGRTRVRSGLTPLQAGSWVVMGFPPLRGVSSQDPTGPRTTTTSATPDVDDLVPLISGAVDHRLDNLKQWIVNLDYGARSDATTKPGDVERSRRLRQAFFDILKILMAENKLEFKEVTPGSYQVIVETDDGPVPIDLLSQGMTSIIGWVGAMLQRMYEIHGRAERPEHEPALVLVDEIDSHLHPAWQQQLVPRLRECFPKLQIIATTHSPLLVAGMKASEVLIARRDPLAPDRVSVAPAPLEFEGLRADQILTSSAFGLMTTRGVETRNEQDEFITLLGNQNRSAEEEKRFKELESLLDAKFHVGETEEQRRVERAVTSTLVAMADPREVGNVAPGGVLPPGIKLALKERLQELFPRKDEEKRP
jgi:ABC-type multidrug transport system ATPase subunit